MSTASGRAGIVRLLRNSFRSILQLKALTLLQSITGRIWHKLHVTIGRLF